MGTIFPRLRARRVGFVGKKMICLLHLKWCLMRWPRLRAPSLLGSRAVFACGHCSCEFQGPGLHCCCCRLCLCQPHCAVEVSCTPHLNWKVSEATHRPIPQGTYGVMAGVKIDNDHEGPCGCPPLRSTQRDLPGSWGASRRGQWCPSCGLRVSIRHGAHARSRPLARPAVGHGVGTALLPNFA